MKKTSKRFLLGMLAVALVFGMAVLGCSEEEDKDETDPALNGTWSNAYNGEEEEEIKFNNGKFEVYSLNQKSYYSKGTYTTKDGEMTVQQTHIYGGGKWLYLYIIKPETRSYSISGNKLTFSEYFPFTSWTGGGCEIYTKK
jgi:hypothetical protein